MISKKILIEADKLNDFDGYDLSELRPIIDASNIIAKSWSGSWLGYQSRVYYSNFRAPPAGAHFSTEWGLYSGNEFLGMGCKGEWVEYTYEYVIDYINNIAGNPSFDKIIQDGKVLSEIIDDVKTSVLSLIYAGFDVEKDKFLNGLINKIESLKVYNKNDFVRALIPKNSISSRDSSVEPKIFTPPHISINAHVCALRSPFEVANELKKSVIKLASHIYNLEFKMQENERVGTNVFIGHGRSPFWRELKDFVNERLGLPWDEFNRVPVAGLSNITRLTQMLDKSCIAFLVMTAEDEQADGNLHARMNVIHEVGLFQGRLGFERAIVLLEEGCEEFSNIQGLGQIRFPRGNISAIFESIRQILEREGIIE